jgi:siroheme synthase
VVAAPLAGLAAAIQAGGVTSPAVVVIGDTARYVSAAPGDRTHELTADGAQDTPEGGLLGHSAGPS